MMFDSDPPSRLFGLPPGVDFPAEVARGVLNRFGTRAPEQLARVLIIANTRRMQRQLKAAFQSGVARLLPRIITLDDLAPADLILPPKRSALERRLQLSQLISALLDRQPELAPRSNLYDLSNSLAALFEEMSGEGVEPEDIAALDVEDQSGHWQRAQQFIAIASTLDREGRGIDGQARLRMIAAHLAQLWTETPPDHPVIIAGSTGSRGATAQLMEAVARLPQGALIVPGFDFDLPPPIWSAMTAGKVSEDHPQLRFGRLMQRLGAGDSAVQRWTDAVPPAPTRNALVSLSLRPAPVTDQWLTDGRKFSDLPATTAEMTLLEAPDERSEAVAIALRLRKAAEDSTSAALITPDRMLTRRVSAVLARWGIVADDSAGMPLQLSPPGRLLRHVADTLMTPMTGEALLVLLKHPLSNSSGDRGPHLRWTHELELQVRRDGLPFPTGEDVRNWANGRGKEAERTDWADWLADWLDGLVVGEEGAMQQQVDRHIALTEALSRGPVREGSGQLWEAEAGRTARKSMDALLEAAAMGGEIDARDYAALMNGHLASFEVRRSELAHPGIRIWGTLEARGQGAELMILGGMNDGVWPEAPPPDPWLNRPMRAAAGMLLPERRVGLSAHDYQQAIAAPEVWISRSLRSDGAQTVPSRWVNRLTNLLGGLTDGEGDAALRAMTSRGAGWLAQAAALDRHVRDWPADDPRLSKASRPSPAPPVKQRPRSLSVTGIRDLIRDPYRIYASKILRLRKLNALAPSPDARLKGEALHEVLERFVRNHAPTPIPEARATLMDIAREVLAREAPWPTVQAMWLAKFDRVADWFLTSEIARQADAKPALFEELRGANLGTPDFTLTAKADRMDLTDAGAVRIYDYKTGTLPTAKAQKYFDKQLLLEAALVARGAFEDEVPSREVERAAYIGVGSAAKEQNAPLDEVTPEQAWSDLATLVDAWLTETKGYTSRRAADPQFAGDFDHLARFGEWDEADVPRTQAVE